MIPPLATTLFWLDLGGITVFAISGALMAVRKRLDFVGACYFALITATGGGTVRDVLIGAPVFWMHSPTPVLICVTVAIAAWAVPIHTWPHRALDWFDAAGVAAYAVYGAAEALQFGIPAVPAIAAGVVTACIGGVIRDISSGTQTIMMRHELYVTPALVAAILFVTAKAIGMAEPWPSLLGGGIGFALRAAAIRWNLALPPHRGH